MRGFDVNRFLRERKPVWEELESTLADVNVHGLRSLDITRARTLGKLYRGVSSDLIQARTELVDATITDYLNDLVARTYAVVYSGRRARAGRLTKFLLHSYPRLVRAEFRAIALATAVFFVGAGIGAFGVAFDSQSLSILIPDQHQAHTPAERVQRDEKGDSIDGHSSMAFSSFLFTHNIKVTFLVFALGITFGVGTTAVMFSNGVPLGALAVQYHQAGEGLFFWAWILPHGIPELTVVFIAGGAGFILARGLILPGRRRRRDALRVEAKRAVLLVLGSMPLLVLSGVIEGTISQVHEPTVPYAVKLVFAVVIGSMVYSYLLFAGRKALPDDEA